MTWQQDLVFVFSGPEKFCLIAGVHHPRDDLAERAESPETNHAEGDREDGEDHQQEVQHHPDAAQTVRLRVSDGSEVQVPWRQKVFIIKIFWKYFSK